jgi:hypothetical protein
MANIGIISEGITDQIVIEYILVGLLQDDDLSIDPLQPTRDATDEDLATSAGNWDKVFEYCESSRFEYAVLNTDFVIVQIDADIFKTKEISEKYRLHFAANISVEDCALQIQNMLIGLIGVDFYASYSSKIVFAISIDSIECWLLPIYFQNQPKQASKTVNCLNALNQVLSKQENYVIDKKKPQFYRKASKPYLKHKDFVKLYPMNPSLKIFVETVLSKNIKPLH